MNDAIIVEKHEEGYNVTFEAGRKDLFVGAINGKFTLELTNEQAKILSNSLYTPKPFVPRVKKEVNTDTAAGETAMETKKPKRAARKKPASPKEDK